MPVVEARDITKTYTIGDHEIRVLENVSLCVSEGEFLVVAGSSGSGKTTLLSLLSGLDKPSSGRVLLEDSDITDTSEDDLAPLRNQIIGFVFQSFHLVPSLTALENVMFPAELKHDPEAHAKAAGLLKRVGMQKRGANYPHQLSGGEMQRVAIARALINNPSVIIADEPTAHLDTPLSKEFMEIMGRLKESSRTVLIASHDPIVSESPLVDCVWNLRDGKIEGEAG